MPFKRINSNTANARELIIETPMYKSGESFGPLRMAREIGCDRQTTLNTLRAMITHGEAQYCGDGLYSKKHERHWIYTTPLTKNSPKCLGERIYIR